MAKATEKNRIPRGAVRHHIVDVASGLFYTNGIRAVGVDTIVAEAGVAKTTLYDHFASKDDLIIAYLEKGDQMFWRDVEATLQQHAGDPRRQIAALFESFETMIASPQSLGCPFLSAASEFPELNQPGHAVALAHKQKLRDRLRDLAVSAGAHAPDQLADQLLLLLDGAFASKRVFRTDQSPVRMLHTTAQLLLDFHLAES
jgi:AcrR family transcriptional regulator